MGEETLNPRDAYRVMLRDYPDVLNIDQMCEILSISTKTGYALLKKGSVQHLKVGRSYRIPKAHLLTYLIGFASRGFRVSSPKQIPPLSIMECTAPSCGRALPESKCRLRSRSFLSSPFQFNMSIIRKKILYVKGDGLFRVPSPLPKEKFELRTSSAAHPSCTCRCRWCRWDKRTAASPEAWRGYPG